MATLSSAPKTPLSNVPYFPPKEGTRKGIAKFSSPVGIFQGYNSVTGAACSTAVTGTSESVGGVSTVKYQVCFSMTELSDVLEVDQALSASFLSVAKVDEKLKFIDRQKVSSYSTSIVVYAKHTMGTETMTDVALKPGIQAPKSSSEVKRFVKAYGDSFLSSRTKGGEYFAVYTFYSESRQKQSKLSAEMQAQGLFSSASAVGASLQVKLNNFRSSQQTRTSFAQSISGIADPCLPSADDAIPFALKFPSLPLTAPKIISFESSGYEQVPGIDSTELDSVAGNRDLITGSGGDTNFMAQMSQIQQLQNDISFIKDIYSFYGGFHDIELIAVEAEANKDVHKVKAMLQAYVHDPTQRIFSPPVLTSLAKGTPSLNYVIETSPEFGERGNTKFLDVNTESYFAQRTRIRSISIRSSGTMVGALRITYESDNKGAWRVIRGSEEHGGQYETPELLLSPGDFVTCIQGSYGDVPHLSPAKSLTKLTIHSSDGREIGTYRNPRFGTGFTWSVPKGCFVMGFAGIYGWYLDQLQAIYGSFRPAVWHTHHYH